MAKSKKYFRRKSKENYDFNKLISRLYKDPNEPHPGETFTKFKKRKKKDLGY